MISQRTIIAGSAGPIFAVFSPNESVLDADDRSGPLSDISRDVAMASNFVKNGKLSTFVTLAFRNGMGYRYLNVRINSVNYASILLENFVKFVLVNPELSELICERQVRHSQKMAHLVEYLWI